MGIRTLTVLETTDYTIFRELPCNRGVAEARKNKIKDSIIREGWKFNPIIVNENMEVIDGQGRLEALKELGLPVQYVIIPGMTLDDCRAMNCAGQVWTVRDWIDSYSMEGLDAWVKIKSLMKEFGANERTVGIVLHKQLSQSYKHKDMTITDEEYETARYVLSQLNMYIPAMKKLFGRTHSKIDAAVFMIEHNVDTMKMVDVINNMTKDMFNASNKETMIKSFQDAYNRNKKLKANRIYVYEAYRKGE